VVSSVDDHSFAPPAAVTFGQGNLLRSAGPGQRKNLEQKSLTAKDAEDAKEDNNPTAKDAKAAKGIIIRTKA
jgi:hypothetical protein